jgi:hypothetical protein
MTTFAEPPTSAEEWSLSRLSRGTKALLMCGVVYALSFVAAHELLAGLLYDGYSHLDQAVSELSAMGASTRPLLAALIPIWSGLLIAFGAAAFGTRFRVYSLVTVVTALVFGALTGTQAGNLAGRDPTPLLGLYERISVGAWLLWIAVLSVVVSRNRRDARAQERVAATRAADFRRSHAARHPSRATGCPGTVPRS